MNEVEIAVQLQDHKTRISSLEHRVGDAEKVIEEIHNISTSVQLLAQQSKNTADSVDKLSTKVDNLEQKPAKTADSIKVAILVAICTGIVSAVVTALIAIM